MDIPITDRLRCKYGGRDFSGPITTVIPTPLMLEAAESIEAWKKDAIRFREALKRIYDHRWLQEPGFRGKPEDYWYAYDVAAKELE